MTPLTPVIDGEAFLRLYNFRDIIPCTFLVYDVYSFLFNSVSAANIENNSEICKN